MTKATKSNHVWRFFRAGGFDQVRLDRGADLTALDQLNQKLWVALACPTSGLEFDARTLALIDTDKDGRVRPPELLAAIQWTASLIKNPDDLVKQAATLPLAAVNDATPAGQAILRSAKQILTHLGKASATEISLDDTADTAKILAQTAFNGDGIIVAESAGDEATKAVIADIIATQGAETDRSGKPGVSQAKVDAFLADATAFDAWVKKSEAEAASVLPLGDATAAASAAVKAVRGKIDDYFGRCRLAAFDSRAMGAVNREEKEYLALAAKELTITAGEVAHFPLAQVAPGKSLSLSAGVNPAWAGSVAAFQASAVKPLLGDKSELTEADWAALGAKLAPYDAWVTGKTGTTVEKLGVARVRAILGSKAKETLTALIAKDKAEEGNVQSIADVDKLIRYYRFLYRLCINFVNFRDFYDLGEPAVFQAGTLYLDQRSCNLCLTVEDAGKHAAMAALAGTYLAYCDCVRKGSGEKLQIVAAFTDGDSDNLMVGRNGIFYDRKGRDWDATITKIIDNPISIRQAFWSPYKKFVRMIEEMAAKRAAAADAASTSKLATAATHVAEADKTVAAKPAEPKKIDVGTVAALGVAFGAIGTFFTAIVGHALGIVTLGPLAIVGTFIGILLLISGPSMILAYIKLRKRNLGPILDANGWAVNSKAKVNVPFGKALTDVAALPPGAQRDLVDAFAEKKSPWPKFIVIALALYVVYAILNGMGYINEWTHGRIGKARTVTTVATPAPAGDTNALPAAGK